MFDPILTRDEIAAVRAMADRIQTTRPDARGRQQTMHFAVETVLHALAAAGGGNPSCHLSLVEAGKEMRKAVLAY